MRLFVALEIPTAVRDNLAALINELRVLPVQSSGKGPRWVRPENVHLTLKFIGEVAPERFDGIRGALAGVRSDRQAELSCRGLGFFPNEKRPQVFWAGLDASQNLPKLAEDIDRVLAAVGLPREQRAFSPHLTLARFEPPRLGDALRAAITQAALREFGSFQAREFHLIESKTKPSGAEYTRVASFSFTPET
ncbi:MAG TPA: RNA 2',3'-cyclic phosphodiesterase [Candidatus Methylomirabilis sp.]|nr:RNA 2',3'-cyclic phosphodiesterase [Candidatus Methylomirabilis sp.]